MPVINPATPLLALDAFVLDTETTGLDPATANIVEIGGVRSSVAKSTRWRRFAGWLIRALPFRQQRPAFTASTRPRCKAPRALQRRGRIFRALAGTGRDRPHNRF